MKKYALFAHNVYCNYMYLSIKSMVISFRRGWSSARTWCYYAFYALFISKVISAGKAALPLFKL